MKKQTELADKFLNTIQDNGKSFRENLRNAYYRMGVYLNTYQNSPHHLAAFRRHLITHIEYMPHHSCWYDLYIHSNDFSEFNGQQNVTDIRLTNHMMPDYLYAFATYMLDNHEITEQQQAHLSYCKAVTQHD